VTTKNMVNWRSGETEYKFSLKTQIDRVAQMFSQRLETSSANLLTAETILVDTCVKSVQCLEAMLPFPDDQYNRDLELLGAMPSGNLKKINEWVVKKFALLMFLMKRKRLLLEEVEDEIEEGRPDEVEFGAATEGVPQ